MRLCAAVQTACSVGKIQLSLRKRGGATWTNLGQALDFHDTFVLKKERGESGLGPGAWRGPWRCCLPVFLLAPHYCQGVLVSRAEVTHNTLIFRVDLPPGAIRHVPVGAHVYLKALVEGEQAGRRRPAGRCCSGSDI